MIELPPVRGLNVAVDTEASGLHVDDGARVSVVSAAWRMDDGELHSHAWPFDQGTNGKPGRTGDLFEQDINCSTGEWMLLVQWLQGQRLIWHNAYYDLPIMRAGLRTFEHGVDLLPVTVWDTMLAAWVLDPLERIGLDEQALIHLEDDGKKVTKAAINPFLKKNGNRYDLVPWSVMEPYAKSDVELTLKLFEQQQERLDGEDSFLRPQCEFEIQEVMPVLVKMAQRGIGYNAARSKIEAARAMAAMSKIDRELPFRPATPAKARLWFFDHEKAIPHCVTEKTGVPSVGECCLRSLVAQQVPGADLYLTRTKYVNAVGKNYIGFAEATGADERLRTDLKQAGTVTMRFASKRVNLQSLPHDYKLERMEGIEPVRSLFQPKEGYELWEFDLAQAEARIAAQKAPCTTWLQFFTDGRDLHAETAVQLFGDSEFEHRQIGKRANFSLIYGVGPATFQRDLEKQTGIRLLDSEAKEVVYGWRKLYPEFGRINKMAEKSALKRKYVVLADGRQYWFRPFDEFHKAFNAYVQGSLAQFVKRWMVAVDEVFGEVLLQIHDSVVVEIREDQVKENVAGIIRVGGEMATRAFGVHMFAEGKKWN